jgi:hypothetical protein
MKSYQPTIDLLEEKGYKYFSQCKAYSFIIDRYELWVKDEDNSLILEVWKDDTCTIYQEVETI